MGVTQNTQRKSCGILRALAQEYERPAQITYHFTIRFTPTLCVIRFIRYVYININQYQYI